MNNMRLDRYLAECGCGTRSEVKNLIKKGRVEVNGKVVKDPSVKISYPDDAVYYDGRKLVYEEFRYFMLNKPQGCVSATRDGLSSTVLDILEGENTRDIFPVGRLDKDTEGLLLITNDGQLGHNLLSPKKHVDKTYIAMVSKRLSADELEQFEEGLDIGDEELTLPANIRDISDGECCSLPEGLEEDAIIGAIYEVIIREGRYHQIKRMFETLGSKVLFLKRVRMGPLELDSSLNPGEYRCLTDEEVSLLKTKH